MLKEGVIMTPSLFKRYTNMRTTIYAKGDIRKVNGFGKAAKRARKIAQKVSANKPLNIFDFTEEEQIFAICKKDMVAINASLSDLAKQSENMTQLKKQLRELRNKTTNPIQLIKLWRISVKFATNTIQVKILNLKNQIENDPKSIYTFWT